MKNLKYTYIYVDQYLYIDPTQQLYFILSNILGFSILAFTDLSYSFE